MNCSLESRRSVDTRASRTGSHYSHQHTLKSVHLPLQSLHNQRLQQYFLFTMHVKTVYDSLPASLLICRVQEYQYVNNTRHADVTEGWFRDPLILNVRTIIAVKFILMAY